MSSSQSRMNPEGRGIVDPERAVEVVEKNTDTAWALFETLRQQQLLGIEATRPADMEPPASANEPVAPVAAPAIAQAPAAITLEDALLEVRRNNRVCPLPAIWKQVWDWLPNKAPTLSTVPTTSAEWAQLPPLHKRSRLREHLEWAEAQGVLQQVVDALRKLPEDRWHHMGA